MYNLLLLFLQTKKNSYHTSPSFAKTKKFSIFTYSFFQKQLLQHRGQKFHLLQKTNIRIFPYNTNSPYYNYKTSCYEKNSGLQSVFFKYFILIMSGQVYKPSRAHIWRWIHWSVAKQLLSVARDVMMCTCMYLLLSCFIVWFAVAPAWALRSALEPIKPKPSSSILFLQACVNCAVGFCTPCLEFLWTLPFCLFFFLRMFISAARCAKLAEVSIWWHGCNKQHHFFSRHLLWAAILHLVIHCSPCQKKHRKARAFPCIFPQKNSMQTPGITKQQWLFPHRLLAKKDRLPLLIRPWALKKGHLGITL